MLFRPTYVGFVTPWIGMFLIPVHHEFLHETRMCPKNFITYTREASERVLALVSNAGESWPVFPDGVRQQHGGRDTCQRVTDVVNIL